MTSKAGGASSGGQPGPSLWSGEPASRLRATMGGEGGGRAELRVHIGKWMDFM